MTEAQRSYTTLNLAFDGPIATLTLNRPDKRNAISYELIDELLRALGEVEQRLAQIVILTGAGKAFCSGMDLDNLRAIAGRSEAEARLDSMTMAGLFRTLYDFPKVTIAASQWRGDRGWLRAGHSLRLYDCFPRGEVRLH